MEKQKKKSHQIQIELDDSSSQGEYVNFTIISHSPAEFILDFIKMLPGMTKAKVKSRLIMAPSNAKSLVLILQDNIRKYEDKFGKIEVKKGKGLQHPEFKIPDDTLPN